MVGHITQFGEEGSVFLSLLLCLFVLSAFPVLSSMFFALFMFPVFVVICG